MGNIFISYSHKDTDYVNKLVKALERHGFSLWVDERLDYGSQWPLELQEHLDTCEAFIVLMTPSSLASEPRQAQEQADFPAAPRRRRNMAVGGKHAVCGCARRGFA